MRDETLTVDGLRVRWEEEGEGIPTVLVHGLPTSPALWRDVVPRLEGARAILWEMVGYGGSISEGAGRDISLAGQAEYLAATLEAAEIPQVVLVGHGVGGGVAQVLATRRPELVIGLILVDSVSYDAWITPQLKIMRALGALLRHAPKGILKILIRKMLRHGHSDAAAAADSFEAHWPYYQHAETGRALFRQIQCLDVRDTLDVAERLSQVSVPTRVVWGANDPFHRLESAYRLSVDLRAPLDVVDDARHFLPEERPDRVAGAINSVLRELATPASRPSRKHARRSGGREGATPESPRRADSAAT